MSAPVVSGAAALLRQYFEEGWHINGRQNKTAGINPRASLIKAVLLNGGQTLSGVQVRKTGAVSSTKAYDFNQGFGRVSLVDSVPLDGHNKLSALFVNSKQLVDGGKDQYTIEVDNRDGCSASLQATLAWTDPPGGASCNEGCKYKEQPGSFKNPPESLTSSFRQAF